MKKISIRKIGVGSFAKYVGIASAILSFVIGVFSALGGTVSVLENGDWSFLVKLLGTVAVWFAALVLYPLVAYLVGWLYGAVVALVLNVFLQSANGIEFEIEEQK